MSKEGNVHLILSDVVSYGNFFQKNYHTACLIASRYISNNQEVEDVVQEVFINIWEKRKKIKIHTNLKNYLYNSVRNTSINYTTRKKEFVAELSDIDLKQHQTNEKDKFVSEEFASEIEQAINSLPPRCLRIFLLAYIDKLTYQEIADTLDISKNTVKTQMGIAYKLLRSKLRNSFFNLFLLFTKRHTCADRNFKGLTNDN